jgi:hypothetical protein
MGEMIFALCQDKETRKGVKRKWFALCQDKREKGDMQAKKICGKKVNERVQD